MDTITFRPAKRYLIKLFLSGVVATGFLSLIGLGIISGVANITFPTFPMFPVLSLIIGVQLLTWIANTLYYFSIRYEIHTDEVIVRSGILTRTVKHVPFRTITNITTNRDLLDQIIGIGSLSIQTAGSGGTSIPEEKLVGVADLQDLYAYIARELRRFRSGMSANQADSDEVSNNDAVMLAILNELRAIRQLLQQA